MAAKRKPSADPQLGLFDAPPPPKPKPAVASVNPATCEHPKWIPGLKVWPGESFERMVKTCTSCGEVRGRAGKDG